MSKHTILLGSKKYPVAFNMIAFYEFLDREGQTLETWAEYISGNLLHTFKLFHFMIEYGSRRNKVEFDLSLEDVADLVGMNMELVNNTILLFMDDEKKPKRLKKK